MSWHVSFEVAPGELTDPPAARDARSAALRQNPEAGDQFDAALVAALALLSSGAVGGPDRAFYVTLSGHANPDHAPRSGWANDAVTVALSQG